jgi:hypothetical protein
MLFTGCSRTFGEAAGPETRYPQEALNIVFVGLLVSFLRVDFDNQLICLVIGVRRRDDLNQNGNEIARFQRGGVSRP